MFASVSSKVAMGAAALSAAGMLLAPTVASAQAYSYQGDRYGYSYDQRYQDRYYGQDRYGYDYDRYNNPDYCRSDRNQRRAAGATIGAGVGAIAGSQLAARGRRSEGSILGGVLGAVIGGSVGNDSAARCEDYDRSRYGYSYDNRGYQYDRGYSDRYDDRYRYERYDDRSRYGCRTVETRGRDWNGRVVTRYEEVCDGY